MGQKAILISVLAMVGVTVLALASAVTVFALLSQSPTGLEEVTQTAPVQLEAEHQPVVVEPVIQMERGEYAGGHGCPYHEAKMQQVQVAPVETVEDNLLSQVAP